MKRAFLHSVAVRLAFRFSLIVAVTVILLSLAFIGMLNLIVQNQKSEELLQAVEIVEKGLLADKPSSFDYEKVHLPYYISYLVYLNGQGGKYILTATNDPYLPVLEKSGRKARKYVDKDFFLDGDLNIYYFTKDVQLDSSKVTIQTALNMETDSFTRMTEQLPLSMCIILIPVFVISFFVTLFITKRTMLPVKRMTATAKELSASRLDTLLPLSKHGDEIDDLALTFNDLFRRIKIDFDRERQFTSDVSHELKTPLAVIMGQAKLLQRWGKDDAKQLDKSLSTIVRESKSMSAIIENLLQISRIENGKLKPQLERFNLFELFERLREEVLSINALVKINIDCKEKLFVIADKELLHQVFTVITSNSLKYCAQAGVDPIILTFSAKETSEKTEIFIKDNGKGFDSKTIDHLFERFYRGDDSHNRSDGGCGLGLSIAKTIINAMEGSISALNDDGAKILITLFN